MTHERTHDPFAPHVRAGGHVVDEPALRPASESAPVKQEKPQPERRARRTRQKPTPEALAEARAKLAKRR